MDSSGNIALAGGSNDNGLIQRPGGGASIPLIIFLQQTTIPLWAIGIYGSGYTELAEIKFNTPATKLVGVFRTITTVGFVVVQASDGTLLYSSKDNPAFTSGRMSIGCALFDSSDNIYLAIRQSQWANANFVKFAAPQAGGSTWELTIGNSDGQVLSVAFGASENDIYFGGYFQYFNNDGNGNSLSADDGNYYWFHAQTDPSGTVSWFLNENVGGGTAYGVPRSSKYAYVNSGNGLLLEGTVYSSNTLDYVQFDVITLNNPASLPDYQSFLYQQAGTYDISPRIVGVNYKSGTIAQYFIEYYTQASLIFDYYYIELDYSSGALSPIYKIGTFSGLSAGTARILDVYFFGGVMYYTGFTTWVYDNYGVFPGLAGITGFLMKTDFASPNTDSCLNVLAFLSTSSSAITPASITGQDYKLTVMVVASVFYGGQCCQAYSNGIGGIYTSALKTTSLISNTWCPNTSPVTLTSRTLATQTYYIGQTTLTYTFPDFIVRGYCSSTTPVTYTAWTNPSGNLPGSITLSSSTKTFSFYETNCGNSGWTYVYLMGSIEIGQRVSTQFWVNIAFDCPILTVTKAGDLTVSYTVDDPWLNVPLGLTYSNQFCPGTCWLQTTCKLSSGGALPGFVSTGTTNIGIWTNQITNAGWYFIDCTSKWNNAYNQVTVRIRLEVLGCGTTTITTFTPGPLVYYVYQAVQIATFATWVSSAPSCSGLITYTSTISGTGAALPSLTTFNGVGKSYATASTALTEVGVYTIEIKGTLQGSSATTTFTITIVDPCPLTTITPTAIANQLYSLYTSSVSYAFTSFTSSFNAPVSNALSTSPCGSFNYALTYSTYGGACPGGAIATLSFVTIDSANRFVKSQTNNPPDVGQYCICVNGYQGTYSSHIGTSCFMLDVGVWCNTATVALTAMTESYTVGSTALVFTYVAFGNSIYSCSYTYTAVYSDGTTLDAAVITFDGTNRQFTVSTTSNTKVGTYVIYVYGALGTTVTRIGPLQITLTIVANPCVVASTGGVQQPNSMPLTKSYTVGSVNLDVYLKPYTLKTCSYTYSYISTLTSGSALPSFITFSYNTTALTFSVGTSDITKVGTYLIMITATLDDGLTTDANYFWTLQVYGMPYFSTALTTQTINAGQTWTYSLPSVVDPQSAYPVVYIISYGSTSTFVSYAGGVFTITPPVNLGTQQYTISIKLKNAIKITSFAYTFTLSIIGKTIAAPTETQSNDTFNASSLFDTAYSQNMHNKSAVPEVTRTFDPNAPPLSAKILSISMGGLVVIEFNQNVSIPANWSAINPKDISVSIIPGSDSNQTLLDFTWQVVAFSSTQMSLQLTFTNPNYVSSSTDVPLSLIKQSIDRLNVTFLNASMFYAYKTNVSIQVDNPQQKSLPKQVSSSCIITFQLQEYQSLQSLGSSLSSTVNSVMYGNMAMNLVLQINRFILQIWFPPISLGDDQCSPNDRSHAHVQNCFPNKRLSVLQHVDDTSQFQRDLGANNPALFEFHID